jgi:hypothetical protein
MRVEAEQVHLTLEENDSALPIAEINRAPAARQLWDRIGPVSKEQVKIVALKSAGLNISPKDVENAIKIYGVHPGCAAGRATEPTSLRERGERQLAMPAQQVKMQSDLMWINEMAFLVIPEWILWAWPCQLSLGKGSNSRLPSTLRVQFVDRLQLLLLIISWWRRFDSMEKVQWPLLPMEFVPWA